MRPTRPGWPSGRPLTAWRWCGYRDPQDRFRIGERGLGCLDGVVAGSGVGGVARPGDPGRGGPIGGVAVVVVRRPTPRRRLVRRGNVAWPGGPRGGRATPR